MKYYLVLFFLFFNIITINAQYSVNGNSVKIDCHCYRLTNDLSAQHGSVWFNNKIDLTQSFDYSFIVFLGCTDNNGADGIAFVLQPISTSVGGTGQGMGYGGITPSVAVTLDTYQNSNPDNDPTYDHIAIQLNGDVNHITSNTITPLTPISATNNNVEDCVDHTLRISWNATTKTMNVWFDGQLRLSAVRDFVSTVFGNNSMVYWGFTGATGLLYNLQKFCTILTPKFHFSPTQKKCVNEPIVFYDSTISATGILKRYWNFGDGSPIDSINVNPVHVYTRSGTYNVTFKVISPDGCEDVFPQTVIIGNSPSVSFSYSDSCISSNIQFTDQSQVIFDSVKYWYWDLDNGGITSTIKNPSTAYVTPGIKNIKLVVTTKFGCRSDTLIKPIRVYAPPVTKFICQDSICVGQPLFLHDTSQVSFGSVNFWQWTYSDSSYPSYAHNPTHVFNNAGNNTVTLVTSATKKNYCTSSGFAKTIFVKEKPRIAVNFTDTCKYFPVNFNSSQLSPVQSINTWHWDFGDGQQQTGPSNLTHTYNHNGIYFIEVFATGMNGCDSDKKLDTIRIFGNDVFAGNDTIVAVNQPLQIQSVGGIYYQWSPTYGLSASNISNPIAQNSSDMVYFLKATTPGGCISYDTIKITVYKGPDIYVPSAFSPNNDGINDVLNPFPVGMKKLMSFQVYNRFGQLIYSTINNYKGWDGKLNGKAQPGGTYVWISSGIDYMDKTVFKKGTVLLIR